MAAWNAGEVVQGIRLGGGQSATAQVAAAAEAKAQGKAWLECWEDWQQARLMEAIDVEVNPGPKPPPAASSSSKAAGWLDCAPNSMAGTGVLLMLVVLMGVMAACVISVLDAGHTAMGWWFGAAVAGAGAIQVLVAGFPPTPTHCAKPKLGILNLRELAQAGVLTEAPTLRVPSTLFVERTAAGARLRMDLRVVNAALEGWERQQQARLMAAGDVEPNPGPQRLHTGYSSVGKSSAGGDDGEACPSLLEQLCAATACALILSMLASAGAASRIMGWWFAAGVTVALLALLAPLWTALLATEEDYPEPTRRAVLRPGGARAPRTRRPRKRALSLEKEFKRWVVWSVLVAIMVMGKRGYMA